MTDFQREKAEDNLTYWKKAAAGALDSADRAFAEARIHSLEAEVERKKAAEAKTPALPSEEALESAEKLDALEIAPARARAEEAARILLGDSNHWSGPTYLSPFLTAEYVLCLKVLGRLDARVAEKAAHYFLRIQKSDGSFGAWDTGETDATITHGVMTALHAIGTPDALAGAARARAWITANHREKDTLFTCKLMAGILGYEPFPFTHQALEIERLRRLPEYGLNQWASWIRALAAPLGIVVGIHPADGKNHSLGPEKKHLLKKLVAWLADLTDDGGHLYISGTTNVMGVLAYHELTAQGFGDYTAQVEAGLRFIRENLLEETETELLVRNPPSINWDTPNMLLGILGEHPSAGRMEEYAKSFDFLYGAQVLDVRGVWAERSPHVQPGGWGTVVANRKNTDTDGSAQVLSSLRMLGRTDAPAVDRHIRGLRWLLGLQGPEGGWATFEKNSVPKHPGPMAFQFDIQRVRELQKHPLKLLTHGFKLLSDTRKDMVLLVDYPFADLTGHVLEGLASFGYNAADPEIAHALEFIRGDLGPYPVWSSRYGIDAYWGTNAALRAAAVTGADLGEDWAQHAVDWVVAHQNPDGGFGQNWESLKDFKLAGTGQVSLPSQTAQGLMILLSAGRVLSPEAQKAAAFLARTQQADGRWTEDVPNCWAGGIYAVNYTLLPQYLPMVALARFQDELARARRLRDAKP